MTRYTYNPAGELIREEEYASGNIDVRTRPLRTITYHRDRIGRIRQKDSHLDGGEILSTHYRYDKLNRLIQAHNAHSELRFGYDHNRLVKEQLIHLDEPLKSGISRSQSKDVAAQITEHRYDVLGNRIQTILPTGEVLNRLYYGSGHLHHVNLDGTNLADIERDALHRPVERTIGKLNTQFQLDPLGRLKQQIAQPNGHNKADPAVLIGRSYQYDAVGNLIRTDDQTNGSRDYTYDALGRITQCADEHYRYDPAHNLTDGSRIGGNRLTQYQGTSYRYDPLGNLIEKQQHDGEIQHYRYNADNQLTEAEIHKPGESPVQYRYRYDPMGRRIAKVHPDGNEIQYLWDGSRLLQEYRKDRTYTYVYTEDRNYEPLAQITTYNGSDKAREILYYHNDQIGIPREMTDEEGSIVWSGDYSGWGKLTREERLKSDVYQPIRLQNQHYDEETGLHYNFFRYYDPEIGRFTQQDPIKLLGGESLYAYASNVQNWIDFSGLAPFGPQTFGMSDRAVSNLYNQGMNDLARKNYPVVKIDLTQPNKWDFVKFEVESTKQWWNDGKSVNAICKNKRTGSTAKVQYKYYQSYPMLINEPSVHETSADPTGLGGSNPEDLGPISKAIKGLYDSRQRAGKCGSRSELQCFLDKDANPKLGQELCSQLKK